MQQPLDTKHERKEPLLPLPSPSSTHSSSPPRPTSSTSRTVWLRAVLAVLALGSLYLQLGPQARPPRHAALSRDAGYLARLGTAPRGHGCPHRHKLAVLSDSDIVDTLLDVPTAAGAKAASKGYTNQTHVAGTDGDHRIALLLKSQWETLLGAAADPDHHRVYDAGTLESRRALTGDPRVWTDTYYSLLNYPISSSISLFASSTATEPSFRAKLREDAFPDDDPTSADGVGIWHGFSKNGSARGQLVYASKGAREDYELLEKNGINVKGAVVIVQYGGSFRGLKVKAAAEAGASACIIYTDLIEDGDVVVSNNYSSYPHGPARAPSSVQRGSAQYLSLYPGDPLTPGSPSYNPALPGAPDRLPRDDPTINVPSIPSLPLSYEDAVPLLRSLNGRGVRLEDGREGKPQGWREGGLGGFGVEYWTGDGEVEVELVNVVEDKITPIWNTYALIPGHVSDEVVVLGNHHDAWTFGAADPSSGTASVHETVRALGALLDKGWKPLRTILLAAWDAEEYGLIGSTEFGEDFPEWLQEHVVAYLNVDVSVSGSQYQLGASPSLADLLRNVSAQVPDPDNEGKTLADRYGGDLHVGPLGSGSDFTVFLQRLGLASANFGMARGKSDPVYMYHSNYDDYAWQSKYGDPSFERHRAVSRVLGLTAVRLADDAVLPINTTAYAVELGKYLDKVAAHPLAAQLDLSTLYTLADKIQRASTTLLAHGAHLASQLTAAGDERSAHKAAHGLRKVNAALRGFERGFLGDEEGLQGREWYRHLGVAPGRWLGYGATTLPGLAEALTLDGDVDRAKVEVERLEKAFKTILRGLEKGARKH
ncbi:uncharacterized protein RHOBADRAFT_38815 [Rhodotorula graminis WP1]|uniref:Zn-dependent exopeptidase n=1 Tax=Rhodotorula graminis (strain WP1) TaxID=578459 RepID=A0A0P9H072_RHOGW|nr:uncharacterized protein RHOBADRAFT_38815 [Rhodotorula graminis WP1]KPV73187.1 hypothetical protein RHOBADRAFT_38815 [Rhodotorula graminis WP1]